MKDVLLLAVHPGQRELFEGKTDQRPSLALFTKDLMAQAWNNPAHGCVQQLLGYQGKSRAWAPADGSVRAEALVSCSEVLNGTIGTFKPLRDADDRLTMIKSAETILPLARAVLQIVPSVEVAVHALGDRSLISNSIKQRGDAELTKFREAYEVSRDLYFLLRLSCLQVHGQDRNAALRLMARPLDPKAAVQPCDEFDSNAVVSAARVAPARFRWALGAAVPESGNGQATAGGPGGEAPKVVAFPYSTNPVTRVQRVSTVASAVNALELAAGVSAQMPGSGAKADAGIDFARRAAGRVDAMERVPEVIGFAGANPGSDAYEFGWVFGPRLSVDAKGNKLLLRQGARTVPVSADISVPGWWTKARLKVRVAWRGGFSESGAMVGEGLPAATYDLPVRFRLNRASYDALTVTVMRKLTSQGYHQARIDKIRPEVLPICKDAANAKLTLLIYGVDLWRNPRVFLGGTAVPQDAISVLPDMTGLSATVDTAALSKQALRFDGTVVVWTNHGVTEASIRTQVNGNCEAAAGQAAAATETTLDTTIERVSPSQISSCDDGVTLALSGRGLPTRASRYRLGNVEAKGVSVIRSADRSPRDDDNEPAKASTVTVTFSGLTKANVGLGELALGVTGSDGLVSVPVKVVTGKCSKEPAPSYAFSADAQRIVARPDGTGLLRLKLSLPAGQRPAVTVRAQGGEITSAVFDPPSAAPASLRRSVQGGVLKLASSVDLKKKTDAVALEVRLRNLFPGTSVKFTAQPPEGDATGPLSADVGVGTIDGAASAKAAP